MKKILNVVLVISLLLGMTGVCGVPAAAAVNELFVNSVSYTNLEAARDAINSLLQETDVTVTGSWSGTSGIELDIPYGRKVTWGAAFSGKLGLWESLIGLEGGSVGPGSGTFELIEGGLIEVSGHNSKGITGAGTIKISGGLVSAKDSEAAIQSYYGTLIIAGGTVRAIGCNHCAVWAHDNSSLVMTGGQIIDDGGRAILGDASISGGVVFSQGQVVDGELNLSGDGMIIWRDGSELKWDCQNPGADVRWKLDDVYFSFTYTLDGWDTWEEVDVYVSKRFIFWDDGYYVSFVDFDPREICGVRIVVEADDIDAVSGSIDFTDDGWSYLEDPIGFDFSTSDGDLNNPDSCLTEHVGVGVGVITYLQLIPIAQREIGYFDFEIYMAGKNLKVTEFAFLGADGMARFTWPDSSPRILSADVDAGAVYVALNKPLVEVGGVLVAAGYSSGGEKLLAFSVDVVSLPTPSAAYFLYKIDNFVLPEGYVKVMWWEGLGSAMPVCEDRMAVRKYLE